jgi:hypothetical protein
MNNEWERMWKEVVLASFKVLSPYLPGGMEINRKVLSKDRRYPAEF